MRKSLQVYISDVRSIALVKSCYVRLLLILSISLFGNNKASCQQGFQDYIDLAGFINPGIDDINFHQDHVWISGNYYNDSLGLWSMYVAKLDTTGKVLWAQSHYDTSMQSSVITNTPTRFSINAQNQLLIPQKYFEENNLGLFILDSLGRLLHSAKYDRGNRHYFSMDVKRVYTNFYLTGIVTHSTYDHDIYIVKTDSTGLKISVGTQG